MATTPVPHETTNVGTKARSIAAALEAELRRLGAWIDPAPPLPEFRAPFGMDVLALTTWLQLVLVPRLHEIADGVTPVPASSDLAAHATREFDEMDDHRALIDLLRQVDRLCVESGPARRRAPRTGHFTRVAAAFVAVLCVLTAASWFATEELTSALEARMPEQFFQRFEGIAAPGAGFSRAIVDATLERTRDHGLSTQTVQILLTRAMRDLHKGATQPLRFDQNAGPEELDARLNGWLAQYEIDPSTPEARTSTKTLSAMLRALFAITSEAELAAIPARVGGGVTLGSGQPLPPHLGDAARAAITISLLLLTLVPATWWFVRRYRATNPADRFAPIIVRLP